MTYKVTVPVVTEPLSLAVLKSHLRVTSGDEDALLDSMIVSAREWCESYTGRGLARQTVEVYLDYWEDEIELPLPPLASVTSIKYKDSAGTETTVAAASYVVDTDGPIGRIVPAYGTTWPNFTAYPVNPIRIVAVTGYLTAPKSVVQAMELLIGEWYAKREAGEISDVCMTRVAYLLAPYRVRWL